MTERAQALEALKRVARDIGTVKDVASRRSDPDRDNRRMLARLSAWRSEILRALNILEAVPPRPPVGSPTTPDMGQGWFVTAGRWGDSIVTIEEKSLSGKPDFTPEDQALVRGAALHLLAFIGQPTPVEPAGASAPLSGLARFDLVSVSFAYTSDHEMERADDGEWVRFDDVFPPASLSTVEPTVHNDLCSWCLTQADHVAASEECYERNSERGRITTRPPVEPAGASEPPKKWIPTEGCTCYLCRAARLSPAPVSPVAPEPPTETECCREPIAADERFCQKCGHEARIQPAGEPAPCVWREKESGYESRQFDTACGGEVWLRMYQQFNFCPFCGHPLTVER